MSARSSQCITILYRSIQHAYPTSLAVIGDTPRADTYDREEIKALGQGVRIRIFGPGYVCQVAAVYHHLVSVDSACISNLSGSDW